MLCSAQATQTLISAVLSHFALGAPCVWGLRIHKTRAFGQNVTCGGRNSPGMVSHRWGLGLSNLKRRALRDDLFNVYDCEG